MIEQTETRLFEREAVVAPKTLESWITWRIFASPYPAKEGFERQINALLRVLEHLGMRLRHFRLVCFPAGQKLIRIVQRK